METNPKPPVASRIVLGPIRFYQRWISPALPPSCRFYPTCSEYAIRAVQIHGVFKGVGLAVIRLLKCGPWHPGGVDHVPPRRRPRGRATDRESAERPHRGSARLLDPRPAHTNPQSTETHA